MKSRHTGSCHCKAIRFEVEAELDKGYRCNCSVCLKVGMTTTIVKPDAFTLLAGESDATAYEWGAKVGKRYFCKSCGVSCFGKGHLAEIGGDYVSVNLNALDDIDPNQLPLLHWDGRHDNWQAGPRETPWPLQAT